MARTRTTIRRIDPWSILKFGFVANLVLLGIGLLAGAVVWYVIQRLELIQTVCELAATVGFEECGVDGGALFDTFLVLGLLGVVIQTGILVFLTFLANLIFDLTGGIAVTLDDEREPARRGRSRGGIGTRGTGATALSASSTESRGRGATPTTPTTGSPSSGSPSTGSPSTGSPSTTGSPTTGSSTSGSPSPQSSGTGATTAGAASGTGSGSGGTGDDDTLFGSSGG